MRALLDTHAFLWFVTGDPRLGSEADRVIRAGGHRLVLSIASVWEIAIKAGLGRLDFVLPVDEFVEKQIESNHIALLPIGLHHAAGVTTLPYHHRDPFDRMLVVQARMEEMPIISADPARDRYGVARVW